MRDGDEPVELFAGQADSMIEALGGAPPVMLGIAVLLVALGWVIREAGPELRQWADRRQRKTRTKAK